MRTFAPDCDACDKGSSVVAPFAVLLAFASLVSCGLGFIFGKLVGG